MTLKHFLITLVCACSLALPSVAQAKLDVMVTWFPREGFREGINFHLFESNGTYSAKMYTLQGTPDGSCRSVLGNLRSFALQLMVDKGFLTREQMEGLLRLEELLHQDQVMFFTATSPLKIKDMIASEAFKDPKYSQALRAHKELLEQFLSSENIHSGDLDISYAYRATQYRMRGTVWMVRGQSIFSPAEYGIPWKIDPKFKSFVDKMYEDALLTFEFGSGSATEEGAFTLLLDQAIKAAIGEAVHKKIPLNRVRIYAHALTPAHVIRYQSLQPFKHVVTVGQESILVLTLDQAYSDALFLKYSARMQAIHQELGRKIQVHEIKSAIEIKKRVLVNERDFKFNGVTTRLYIKSSSALEIVNLLQLYRQMFPRLSQDEVKRLVAHIITDDVAISAPITSNFLRDELHTALAPEWPKNGGWTIQNLDEKEERRSPGYAFAALRTTYRWLMAQTYALDQITPTDPIAQKFFLSHPQEAKVTVVTSSSYIRDQLKKIEGSVVEEAEVSPDELLTQINVDPQFVSSPSKKYYRISFDSQAMHPFAPKNDAEGLELDKMWLPQGGEYWSKRIQEFIID